MSYLFFTVLCSMLSVQTHFLKKYINPGTCHGFCVCVVFVSNNSNLYESLAARGSETCQTSSLVNVPTKLNLLQISPVNHIKQ